VSLKDSTGAKLTGGTTVLTLYELQSDGTLKSYDFNDNTFKTTVLTTPTLALTHRTGNNGGTNTGLWTVALATLAGFTAGGVYFAQVNNTGASPPDQEREFQFGSAEGDLSVTAGYLAADLWRVKGADFTPAGIRFQKNTAFAAFDFPMYATGTNTRLPGLTVTAQRRIDGGSFVACDNAVSEIASTGVYTIDLTAADLNGTKVALLFAGAGSDGQFFNLVTQG
jgi:hypothetical protein